MAATGLGWEILAGPAAFNLGIAGSVDGFLILWNVGGWSAVRRLWIPTLRLGISMAGGLYLTVIRGFWSIGTLAAGSLGLLLGVPLARLYREPTRGDQEISWRQLLTALSGYFVLVCLTLFVQLIPAVRDFLGQVTLGVEFPALSTASGYTTPAGPSRQIPIFRHAGAILLISASVSWIIFRAARWTQAGSMSKIVKSTLSRMIPSSVGITSMVMMAVIMQHAGMIDILARGLSTAVRWAFPAVSPWLGALGAFMTGSNTNSNLLMASLQLQTADYLGIPAALILAAQTAGGALGSVVAPTKVIVGATTAGISGQEGEVMRLLLPPISGLIFLVSVLSLLGTLLS
jgi:lactate permease